MKRGAAGRFRLGKATITVTAKEPLVYRWTDFDGLMKLYNEDFKLAKSLDSSATELDFLTYHVLPQFESIAQKPAFSFPEKLAYQRFLNFLHQRKKQLEVLQPDSMEIQHPVFASDHAKELFERLCEENKSARDRIAIFSCIYWRMSATGMVYSTIKPMQFVSMLNKKYNIDISRLHPKARIRNSKYWRRFQSEIKNVP